VMNHAAGYEPPRRQGRQGDLFLAAKTAKSAKKKREREPRMRANERERMVREG